MSRCWKFGDNVATDEILPFQYMTLTEPAELGLHVLENARPGFAQKIAKGDIIVAGGNFGYGSSREQAPLSLKGAGAGAVVARTFARIFFRNCINIGLPAIVCPEASADANEGDDLAVDIAAGTIRNNTKGAAYAFPPFPESVMEYLRNGGLVNTVNKRRSGVL
ncbi:MAG: 3-isopropylmalate dehydratase small subunit [Planctomycetota bacterium]|jgi:3-isopropylmalate/(R)-2-methylmalate dehydratase small subunit|nr:3-isopropylmalate dehydratase small subunit [Planctomycetota bacterium]